MDYKYSNASINISQYSQYNISVRPFYLGLKLLFKLKKLGIDKIENRLFFSSVGCTISEDLNEVTSYLNNWIKEKGNFLNSKNHSDSFQKEATRIATGMKKFYYKCDLIKKEKVGILTYVSITKKGEVLFLNTPPNTLFYGKTDKNTGLYYSPIIARLLSIFSNNVKNHLFEINKENLTDSFKGFKGLDVFDITLKNISDLNPSPIKKIDDDKILLNDFSCQYEVSPYNDFCNENEINFIYDAVINVDNIDLKSKKLELPNQAYINELNEAARSGDGDRYELAIYKAFSLLPGSCKHFGSSYTGQRVSDVVWKISMPTTDGNKTYLVLIEAKSGSAIKSLNERNIIPQLENTIEFYFSEFDNIDGLWVLICNSDKIPSQDLHGGFRGANSNQLSFNQKLFKIQEAINNRFGRTTLVTAFGIEAFIDYYKYLYSNSRFTLKNNTIDKAFLTEFFTYGSLFTMNFSVKSTVFKNSTEFNNIL